MAKEKKLRSIFFCHLHSVLLSNPSCEEGPVLTGGGMEVYYLGRGGGGYYVIPNKMEVNDIIMILNQLNFGTYNKVSCRSPRNKYFINFVILLKVNELQFDINRSNMFSHVVIFKNMREVIGLSLRQRPFTCRQSKPTSSRANTHVAI